MNYQLLLEYYSSGTNFTLQEIDLLDIELYSQLESIKVSSSQGCLEVAPDHISKACSVCRGSLWITCLAAVLDKIKPPSLGTQARGSKVFDELIKNGYLAID
ncbi:hypothetical protein [Prochlorococcus marinus]|uniref:Uncharacterized protein n=1 Tax=Prochlorococcus marinus (strain MIT 9211) TaxID=93059 RepID=A9BC24_PROM4|nr:hypothetical protein [Prochlorococcus marinus]ABX09386.1 Hypothetical protein P9211_14551 [Prochlorococcus marinus str. MIT 9211]